MIGTRGHHQRKQATERHDAAKISPIRIIKVKKIKPLLLLPLASSALLLTSLCNPAWAAGCQFVISSSESNFDYLTDVTLTPSAEAQSFLPDQTNLIPKNQNQTVTYWGKNQNNVSKTIIFKPESTAFTADASNSKGWLVDSSVPGLYFTLSVNMPAPNGVTWGQFTPPMPIYLSNDSSINQSKPNNGSWGCASDRNETKHQDGNMTFSLSFYTTSIFDPAQAAGKQLLTTKKRAGTLENSLDNGGEFDIYLQGPLTIAAAGCGAFSAEKTVDLGEIPLNTLKSKPNDEHNKTPFEITLKNCYAKPTLIVNLATNPSTNNLLSNNQGSAKGVGVGLGYITSASASQRLDLSNPNTVAASDLEYASNSSDGILHMYAILGVTDKSALSAGSVSIPTVITLTHP
ncbi:fimbrial protein [Salmonella enterica]|uniref:fimbrial protein n=1 Tax=Salmonella enterica TaxID=28901 RepID=UPI0012FE4EC2|nr:fimbrial protein [Salmonella enterica]